MATAQKNITLLPQEGFEYTQIGRVVNWTLTVGRTIVVVVELLVVLAFLSRFWLDRQLTDLNEDIQRKVQIIKAASSFEQEFTQIQNRLKVFSQASSTPDFEDHLKKIFNSVPSNVTLNQISLDLEEFKVTGIALSEQGIAVLANKLKGQNLGKVTIESVTLALGEIAGENFVIKIAPEKKQ